MTTLPNPTVRRVENMETARLTHEDFMRLAPEGQKAELIEAEMVFMPPAFYAHERLQSFLFTVLGFFVSRFDLGQLLGSRTAVYLSETETYEPDILFVSHKRAHIITEQKLVEAPDLVVEILSASTARYDRGAKLENYAKAGVRELWLIDPYGPAGTQFFQRPVDRLVEVAPAEGVLHSIVLPDFHLKVDWLWPDTQWHLPNPTDILRQLGAL
jgi:Uma2 family endonuclease